MNSLNSYPVKNKTRRQKLASYVGSGTLRQTLEMKSVDSEVIDLLVDIALRYCEPRK